MASSTMGSSSSSSSGLLGLLGLLLGLPRWGIPRPIFVSFKASEFGVEVDFLVSKFQIVTTIFVSFSRFRVRVLNFTSSTFKLIRSRPRTWRPRSRGPRTPARFGSGRLLNEPV